MKPCEFLHTRKFTTCLLHVSVDHVGVFACVASYVALLRDCIQRRTLSNGMSIHHCIVQDGLNHILPLCNSLLQMYGTCSTAEMVSAYFMHMTLKDHHSWNHIIRAYGREDLGKDASLAFLRMLEEGIMPNSHIFSSILSALSGESGLMEGMQVHVRIAGTRDVDDVYVGTALVSMYGKYGCLKNIERVFYDLQNHDVALWNIMIALYIQQERKDSALSLFNKMSIEGASPTVVTYLSILNACDTPIALRQLHLSMMFHPCKENSVVQTAFLNAYGKLGHVDEALRVFVDISERDSVCWNAIVGVYSLNEEGAIAIQMFHRMCLEASSWDNCSFCTALCACANEKALDEGKRVHALLSAHGHDLAMKMGNALANMYGKCGDLNNSWRIFCSLPDRDVVSWNVIISAHAQQNEKVSVYQLYEHMIQEDTLPNNFTMLSMVESCSKEGKTTQASERLLAIVFVMQLHFDTFVGSALVTAYGKWGKIEEAQTLIDEMPIRDRCIYINFLLACAAQRVCKEGQAIHAKIIATGFDSELPVATALIAMYGKAYWVEDAWAIFGMLEERDNILWTAMISAFLQNKQAKNALQLFGMMLSEGRKPDKIAIISMLDACADDVALAVGRAMHDYVMARAFESDVVLGTALLNMYGRCGMLDDACRVFRDLPERDVVTWSVIVAVHAQQGRAREARNFLNQMREAGIEPNEVTFIGILNACSHSGLVDEGRQWFRSMKAMYGIIPAVDHYNCMIDLLARAGLMEEAATLVQEMPVSPTSSTWTSFLGPCIGQQDADWCGFAADNVFELSPDKVSPYVALSNVYTAAGQQSCLSSVRS